MKKTAFDFDFSSLAIKGRGSRGNIISKVPIKSITQREEGVSTLGAINIWYDDTVKRLNTEERGEYIGAFVADDKILTVLSTGEFKIIGYDLSTHFDSEMVHIRKLNDKEVITVVYFDGEQEKYYVKRFQLNGDLVLNRKYSFISEGKGSGTVGYSFDYLPRIEVEIKSKVNNEIEFEVFPLADFIGVKSYKAKGKRLSNKNIRKIKFIDPLPYTPPEGNDETEETEIMSADKERDSKSKPIDENPSKSDDSSADVKKEKNASEKPAKPDKEPPQMELEF